MTQQPTETYLRSRKHLTDVPSAGLRVTIIASLGGVEQTSKLVSKPVVHIGRSESADVVLPDSRVSLFHVEVRANRRDIWIRDCGSTNGIRLENGIWIQGGWLPNGSKIEIGRTQIQLDIDQEIAPVLAQQNAFGCLIGASPKMRACFADLERVAWHDISVLLLGATGTGKELAARAIHQHSQRSHKPLVVLNCASITPTMAQSELFGHKKGSFTGASADKKGIFEIASGGTLFMDEIGELSLETQCMLLRTLQENEVTRVGDGGRPIKVDARVICATNRDLLQMMNAGKFRDDLYHRLATGPSTITLPSLSERSEDIPMLIEHFMDGYCRKFKIERVLAPDAINALVAREYPGNVRELENIIRNIVALATDQVIDCDALIRLRGISADTVTAQSPKSEAKSLKQSRKEHDREYLVRLMSKNRDNISRAAREAHLSRHKLRDLLVRHGLREPSEAALAERTLAREG